jgi:anaerobic dimethyl sulfoxide reductase subunit B (iron-sulfur subunit)
MTEQYAFLFDARYCSGCKACQAACKDKNHLPPGVLWRRVMEISGGNWEQDSDAWNQSVFAYNLSISCNHCLHPKCVGICPVNAYFVREDGIVVLDETKCMGCGYCAWGCPYGVPQYNPEAGHMSKCDFCFDLLEQGLPPACVAACPLRVLEYGEMTTLTVPASNEILLWESPSDTHPYPLPAFSHTQPRLAIKQHPAMYSSEEKHLANQEEIRPRLTSAWEDTPLLVFTLLTQVAVGGLWAMVWMFSTLWSLVEFDATRLRLLPILLIGGCLSIGVLTSLAHLGTKKNAWRVFANLRHSSLSKEVFYTGIFGIGVLFGFVQVLFSNQDLLLTTAFTAIAGLCLVHNMAEVYRLPAAPGWNTWKTIVGFFVSALLLGISAMAPILGYESTVTGIRIPPGQLFTICAVIILLLVAQFLLMRKRPELSPLHELRIGLLLSGTVLAGTTFLLSNDTFTRVSLLLFAIVMLEEILGRWLFYRSRL